MNTDPEGDVRREPRSEYKCPSAAQLCIRSCPRDGAAMMPQSDGEAVVWKCVACETET